MDFLWTDGTTPTPGEPLQEDVHTEVCVIGGGMAGVLCAAQLTAQGIDNVLKRYEGRPNLLEGADFLLDRQTYTLYIHNQSVVLPPNQGKLLETLLAHGGQTVAKDDLSRALWGTTEFIDENALQVNLTRLKKTMASLGMHQQLVSVRGVGYRLEVPHEA